MGEGGRAEEAKGKGAGAWAMAVGGEGACLGFPFLPLNFLPSLVCKGSEELGFPCLPFPSFPSFLSFFLSDLGLVCCFALGLRGQDWPATQARSQAARLPSRPSESREKETPAQS